MTEELERLRKSIGGELVPYGAYEPQSMGGPRDRHGSRFAGARTREPASHRRWGGGAESRRCVTPSIAS